MRHLRPGRRVLAALAIVITAFTGSVLLAAAPASAAGQSLTLSDGPYSSWAASGSGFGYGRSDVQLWVMDVTGGGWTTLEYQSGITTSRSACNTLYCVIGGRLSAKGALRYIPPGVFGGYWTAVHPVYCGHSYQPVAYDPADGWVYGTVFNEAACPIIH